LESLNPLFGGACSLFAIRPGAAKIRQLEWELLAVEAKKSPYREGAVGDGIRPSNWQKAATFGKPDSVTQQTLALNRSRRPVASRIGFHDNREALDDCHRDLVSSGPPASLQSLRKDSSRREGGVGARVISRSLRQSDRAMNLQKSRKSAIVTRMKTSVIVTSRGVVSLPAKLRRAAGIKPDDQLIAETTPEGILLRPAVTLAVEIYSDDRIRGFDVEEDKLAKALAKRKPR